MQRIIPGLGLLLLANVNVFAQTYSTQSSATFPAPLGSARVTVADFDKDGDADILYQTGVDGTPFKFARSNGNGTFTDQTQAASPFAGLTLPDHNGYNYHVADFDKDGDLDLWVAVNGATGSYFRNDNGTFTSQTSATFPNPASAGRTVIGDFDKDGDADILYQTGGNGTAFSFARCNGNGTFTIQALSASPFAGLPLPLPDNTVGNYHVADFDGDGDVDVWVTSLGGAPGFYFRNDNGVFTSQSAASFPTPLGAQRATAGDFDTDGDADILYQTAGNGTPFQYARSNGDGTFTIQTLAASPFASIGTPVDHNGNNYQIADYDKDGDQDVWGAANGATGGYYSKDGSTPLLVSFTPANNANGVSQAVNITYTFSESVTKGSGNIIIRRLSDNADVETIPVTSAQVTGSGINWTIDPSITLAPSTQYAILSNAGTWKNVSGIIFGGVSFTSTQQFATNTIVTSVGVPANKTYKAGDNLNFTVNLSGTATVNTAVGTPSIPVTIGATVRNATYISGTGTNALVFRYTTVSGEADNDGVSIGSSIALNGGTIKDAFNADALLALNSIGSTTGVLVDGIAPSANSITRQTPNTTTTSSPSIIYRVTFSESVLNVDISDFILTATGASTGTIASVSASTGTIIDVTVNSVSGIGTLRLDLKASGTGITDAAGNPINGGYTAGETYTIIPPLPLRLLSVKAYQKANNIQVEWTTASESDMDRYEVERSDNAQQFTTVGSVAAKGNSTTVQAYLLTDVAPNSAINYYRIRSITKTGETSYSAIVKVNIARTASGIKIYPNPIKENVLTVQLNHLEKGSYVLILYNATGQQLLRQTLEHAGGSAAETIRLDEKLPGGIYHLQLSGNNMTFVENIVKD